MLKQVAGMAAAIVGLLIGGFLFLASSFAILDGERDPVVYCYAVVGASMVLGVVVLMLKVSRRPTVKHTPESDESW